MSDVFSAALEDAGGMEVKDSAVKTIATLATRQLDLQAQIEQVEEMLDNLKAQLKQVSELDLPTAMIESGMKEFKLSDGAAVKIQKVYGASIKVENRPEAYTWFVKQGHAGLIKTEVVTEFGKGDKEREEALKFMKDLQADGFEAKLEESIHHSTLRAFVKEQIEAGVELPPIITTYVGDVAKITLPKLKK